MKDVQISVKENEYKIENGNLIIVLNPEIEKALGINKVQLSALVPGDIFTSGGIEYIVFEHCINGTTRILRKEVLENEMEFGSNNDWKESKIRKYLNSEYLKEIEKVFGSENIIEHEVDLFSHDGLRDYQISIDKVSLLTFDQYRNNREVIGANLDTYWWLSTPDSTPSGYGDVCVLYVCEDGRVNYLGYCWDRGVRPALTLLSSIFVSLA